MWQRAEFLLLQFQFYQCSFFSSLTLPSSPMPVLFEFLLLQVSESTVLWCSTHSRDQSSLSSSFNFIGVHSSPVSILLELLLLHSILSQFLLVQCQVYLSSFCSNCHRVQCSAVLHTEQRPELFLLWFQFYQSSFFSSLNFIRAPSSPLNFITVPSSPMSGLFEFFLIQVS